MPDEGTQLKQGFLKDFLELRDYQKKVITLYSAFTGYILSVSILEIPSLILFKAKAPNENHKITSSDAIYCNSIHQKY